MSPGATPQTQRPFSGRSGFFATLIVSAVWVLLFQWGRLFGATDSGAPLRFDQVVPAGDALHFAQRWEAARVALIQFHQFPSWNPYECGGVALFGDAEAPFPGPLFLLTFFWLPTPIAMNVWMLLHLVLGAVGAAWLARDEGAELIEQWLAAVLVAGCSFWAHHFLWEHLSFAPFCWLPWILWAHRRSLKEPRWAILTGALFALSVMEGGANPTPLMAVVLGLDSLLRLGDPMARRTLARSLPIALVTGLLLSAPRLLAIASVMRSGRSAGTNDGLSLSGLLDALTQSSPSEEAHAFGWDEYSAYVGWLPLGLAILGGIALWLRKQRLELLLCVLLCWLAMGDVPALSPYRLLKLLPVYRELRVPSRFLFPAVLSLSLLAAAGLRYLRVQFGGRRWFGVVLLVLVTGDLLAANREVFRAARIPGQPAPVAVHSDNFWQAAGTGSPDPSGPLQGHGSVSCYHPQYPVTPAAGLRIGPVPQQWLEPAEAGDLSLERWTPNELRFNAVLRTAARVVANQNDAPDWQVEGGQHVAHEGLVAVEVSAGENQIVLRHRPPFFAAGWLCVLCGMAWAFFWWRRG